MSKHIKNAVKVFVVTFLVVVTAGAVLPFIPAGAAYAAGVAGLSGLSTLLSGLLSKGLDASGANFNQGSKIANRGAQSPRQIIYGRCRVGGTITHIETAGTDNHKLRMIVVLAGHEIEELENILINDVDITSVAGSGSNSGFRVVTNTEYVNTENENDFGSGRLMRFVFKDGSQTAADSTITDNSVLGANDKFIDCAYVFIEMVFDSEKFGGGIPPLSFIVKGKKVYDPRLDSTVGGSGSQRFNDPTTHTFSQNPALHILDYVKDTTYGLKATQSEVNLSGSLGSFRVAANTCDVNNGVTTATNDGAVNNSTVVTIDNATSNLLIDVGQKVTGTGIPNNVRVVRRLVNTITLDTAITINDGITLTFGDDAYTSNGFVDFSAAGGSVIEGILSSMAGRMSYVNGQFVVFAGASVTPTLTINDENLLAPITVVTKPNSGENYNTVKAIYVDANNNFVATDSPVFTSTTHLNADTPTGESTANYRKELEIQLPFTDSTTVAQRIARLQLLHSRQDMTISMVCNINYMKLQPFDYVRVNNERLNFSNKVFEVLSVQLEIIESDEVPMVATRLNLKEIDASIYTFATSDYITPVDEGDMSNVETGSYSVPAPTSPAVELDIVNTGYDLKVTWQSAVDDNVQGTEILYGTSSGTYDSSILAGKGSLKEIINNVKPDTTYFICLRHFSSNNVFSVKTSELQIATGTVNAPATISDLSRVQDKPFHIGLTWTNPNNSDLREIRIHRATSSFTTGQATNSNLVRTIGAAPNVVQQASFGVEDGLTAGTTYYFRVVPVSYFNKVGIASNEVNGSFAKVAGTDIQTNTRIVAGTHPNVGVLDGSHASLRIYAGNLNTPTDAPFQVTQTGLLTAENATISGTVKTGQEISVGAGARTVNISGSTGSQTILTAGSATLTDAPFRVLADGTVELSKVNIFTTDGGQVFDSVSGFTGLGVTNIAQGLGTSTSDYTRIISSTDVQKITLTNSDTSSSQDHTIVVKARFNGVLKGYTSSGALSGAIAEIPNKIQMKLMQSTQNSQSSGTQTELAALGGSFTTGASRVTSITNASQQFLIQTFSESDNFFTTNEAFTVSGQGLINSSGLFEISSNNLTLTVPAGSSSKDFFFYIVIDGAVDSSNATATAVLARPRTINITGESFFVDSTTGAGSDSSVGDITAVIAGTNLNGGGTSGSVTLNLDTALTGLTDLDLTSGNKTIFDGVGANNLTIGASNTSVIVAGDLTVQGTTTTLNTATLNVEDKNITLNYSTGDSSGSANGAGITIQDAVNSTTDATILWDATNDEFDFSHGITLPDDKALKFGAGNDLVIDHNSSNTVSRIIDNSGTLNIQQSGDDGFIRFQTDDGSGGVTTYYQISGASETNIFFKDIKLGDNLKANFGASNDLQIYHDGAQSIIQDAGTGQLQILAENTLHLGSNTGSQTYIRAVKSGAVELYHSGNLRFSTLANGNQLDAAGGNFNTTASTTVGIAAQIKNTSQSSNNNGDYKGAIGFTTGNTDNVRSAIAAKQTHTSANRQGLAFLVHPDTSVGTLNEALVLNHDSTATFGAGVSVTGTLTATTLAGTLSTASQPNITSVGTLTSLSSGAITSTGQVKAQSLFIDSGGFSPSDVEGRHFKYYLVGQGTDQNFKKVADVTIGTGNYKALALRVVLESQGGNFGNTVAVNKSEFVCNFYRSEGSQDSADTATISGKNPTNHNLRIVKTATGVYELQVKQTANYKDAILHIEILSTNGGSITITDGNVNGSTSGTVTIPTSSETAATITANRFDCNFFNTSNFTTETIATTGTGNITSQQFLTVSPDGSNTMSMFHSSNNFDMKRLDNDGQIRFMNSDTTTPFVFDMTTATPVFTTTGTITLGDSHQIGDDATDNLVINSSSGESIVVASNQNIFFNTGATSLTSQGTNRMLIASDGKATFNNNITIPATVPSSKGGKALRFPVDADTSGTTELEFFTPLSSPASTLTVNNTLTAGAIDIPSNGTNSTRIEIGTNPIASHFAFIDLVGDTTYTDYGLRLLRSNGGANTTSQLVHRGTGSLFIEAQDAGSVILKTNGSDALTINSSQNATFAGSIITSKTSEAILLDSAHSKTKIGLFGGIGTGAEYIGTSAATVEISGTNINFNGASGSGTPNLKMGTTTVIDSSRNLTNIGTIASGDITISDTVTPVLKLSDTGNAGGGAASGKVLFANTAGNAMGIGYTVNVTADSDMIISTNAGGTYGGYLGLNANAITDAKADIVLEPKTNVFVATGSVGVGQQLPTTNINTNSSFFRPDTSGKFVTINGGANGGFIMLESTTTTDSDQIGGLFWTRTAGQGDAHKQVAGIDAIQEVNSGASNLDGARLRFFTKPNNAGTNTPRLQIDEAGKIYVGATDILDQSRNLTNIGTISSGAITSSGVITATNTNSHRLGRLTFRDDAIEEHQTSSDSAGVVFNYAGNGNANFRDVIFYNGKNSFVGRVDGSAKTINIMNGYQINGTTVIDSSRNLTNIGTISSGNIAITTTGSSQISLLDSDNGFAASTINVENGGRDLKLTTPQDTIFVQGSTESMRILDGGNIGIGNTSPSHKLQVNDNSAGNTTYAIVSDNNGASGTTVAGLGFANGGSLKSSITAAVFGNDFMTFNVGGSGTTERMRIDSSGRLGIGTSSPRAILDLKNSGDGTLNTTASNYQILLEAPQGTGDYGRNIGWAIGSGTVNASINAFDAGASNATGLAFSTGAESGMAERLRIDSSGNVGIGTSTIRQKLHQHVGDSGANYHLFTNTTTGTGTTDGFLVGIDGDENALLWNFENTAMKFTTNNTERLSIGATGLFDFKANNLTNIGTISSGTINAGNVQLTSSGSIEIIRNGDAFIDFKSSSSEDFDCRIQQISDGIQFITGGNGAIATALTLNSSQNATFAGGIASGNIEVGASDTTNGTITVHGGAAGNAEGGEIRLQTSADHDGTYDFYRLDVIQDDFRIGRQGQTDFYIFQDGLVKAENNFQAGGSGNFGNLVTALAYQVSGTQVISSARNLENIGTVSCGNITMAQSGEATATFQTSNSSGADATVIIKGARTAGLNDISELKFDNVASTYTMAKITGGQEVTHSNKTGNLRFYTSTNSSSGLEVKAQINSAGVFACANDVAAFSSLSDIRLKENIELINNPLDKIKSLRGVNFSYKKDGRESTGLIAQELEKVLPNAVYTTQQIDDDEDIKAIRYGNVVGLLVEAIKEQQEQIEELKAKLDDCA